MLHNVPDALKSYRLFCLDPMKYLQCQIKYIWNEISPDSGNIGRIEIAAAGGRYPAWTSYSSVYTQTKELSWLLQSYG